MHTVTSSALRPLRWEAMLPEGNQFVAGISTAGPALNQARWDHYAGATRLLLEQAPAEGSHGNREVAVPPSSGAGPMG